MPQRTALPLKAEVAPGGTYHVFRSHSYIVGLSFLIEFFVIKDHQHSRPNPTQQQGRGSHGE